MLKIFYRNTNYRNVINSYNKSATNFTVKCTCNRIPITSLSKLTYLYISFLLFFLYNNTHKYTSSTAENFIPSAIFNSALLPLKHSSCFSFFKIDIYMCNTERIVEQKLIIKNLEIVKKKLFFYSINKITFFFFYYGITYTSWRWFVNFIALLCIIK